MTRTSRKRQRGQRADPATYHHGDLASALVEVSLELLEEAGLEAFSLREAAARCGVVVSSAYKHFASKDDLLAAVADRGFLAAAENLEKLVRKATAGLSGRAEAEARLVALGRAYILFALARPNLFRLLYGPHGVRGGRGDERPDSPARRSLQALSRALEDVLDAYGKRDADLRASVLVAWSIVHGFATMVIDGVWAPQGNQELEEMIAHIGAAVLRSLR